MVSTADWNSSAKRLTACVAVGLFGFCVRRSGCVRGSGHLLDVEIQQEVFIALALLLSAFLVLCDLLAAFFDLGFLVVELLEVALVGLGGRGHAGHVVAHAGL